MGSFVLFAETALLQRSKSTSSKIFPIFFCHDCIYRVAVFAQNAFTFATHSHVYASAVSLTLKLYYQPNKHCNRLDRYHERGRKNEYNVVERMEKVVSVCECVVYIGQGLFARVNKNTFRSKD